MVSMVWNCIPGPVSMAAIISHYPVRRRETVSDIEGI
jgi:hypothetical protein